MELCDDILFGGNDLYVDLGPFDYCPQDLLNQRLKDVVIDRAEKKCEICGQNGEEIHCRWEATRSGWYMKRYIFVCILCHSFQHASSSTLFSAIEHANKITKHSCKDLIITINNSKYDYEHYISQERRIFYLDSCNYKRSPCRIL